MCYYATLEKLCNVQEDILILYIYKYKMCVCARASAYILQAVDNLNYVVDTCDTSLWRVRNENWTEIHRERGRGNTNHNQIRFIIVALLFHSSSPSAFLLPAHWTVYGFVNVILLYIILFCAEVFFHYRRRFPAI